MPEGQSGIHQSNQDQAMNRRTFVQYAAAAGTSISLSSMGSLPAPSRSPYAGRTGLQLYTVRTRLTGDVKDTLRQVAEAGYKEIEFFMPNLLDQYVPMINDLGMKVVSTHFMPGFVTGKWGPGDERRASVPAHYGIDQIMETCARHGIAYAGVPVLFEDERNNLDEYRQFADQLNSTGERFRQAGVRLFYHNHSFEFAPMEGALPMQILADRIDAAQACIELDVFWAAVAGQDPTAWIKKLKGKIDLLHLKDIKADTPVDVKTFGLSDRMPEIFLPVGKGILDFKTMLKVAARSGVRHCFVEQDVTTGDIMADIAASASHLKKFGF
jgi:sugar phosphate isomerase/epimerase